MPPNKSKARQKKNNKNQQCIIGRSPGSAVVREGLGAPVFQKTAGPLRTQNLNLEDLGVFNDGSGFPLLQMRSVCSLFLTALL